MKNIAREKFQGVYGLVLTPFKDNYEIDEKALRRETRLMVDNGVHVITPVGSTGEFASLTIDEHKKVIEIVGDEVKGDATFIPGTSGCSQEVVLDLMGFAKKAGADAVMVLPPYYFGILTDEAVFEWYQALAKADIGIVIYNNPMLTKFNQPPELLNRLAELDHIVGVKEAHAQSIQFYKTLRLVGDKIPIMEGMGEPHALEAILLGADGFYTGVPAFAPKLCVALYNALKERDLEESIRLADIFEKYYRLFFFQGTCKFIANYKASFEYFGGGSSVTRLPILPITKDEKEKLIEALSMMKEEEEKL